MNDFEYLRTKRIDYDYEGSYLEYTFYKCKYKNFEVYDWEDKDRTVGFKSHDFGKTCDINELCDKKDCIYKKKR